MSRITICALLVTALLAAFHPARAAAANTAPPGTASLLKGEVYKQSGMVREGIVTIRTTWKLPGEAPVFRYNFEVLHGTTAGNLYSFMMADIAEIAFLPMEDGAQPVNLRLRNGLVQKVILTTDAKGILGKVNLRLNQVDIITEAFGENVVNGGDVAKIVFARPAAPGEETISALVDNLDKALIEGRRDKLVDEDLLVVLRALQSAMKARLKE